MKSRPIKEDFLAAISVLLEKREDLFGNAPVLDIDHILCIPSREEYALGGTLIDIGEINAIPVRGTKTYLGRFKIQKETGLLEIMEGDCTYHGPTGDELRGDNVILLSANELMSRRDVGRVSVDGTSEGWKKAINYFSETLRPSCVPS